MPLTRRQFLAAGAAVGGAALAGGALAGQVWPVLSREDLVPGAVPDLGLAARAWAVDGDRLTFAAVGDTGTGGRQAAAVATRMARDYGASPYGLITHLGDICYYGDIEERFADVFLRPYAPLLAAGVRVELAIGNHDGEVHLSDARLAAVETELRLLGTPARYYRTTHGPVDFFYLDSGRSGLLGPDGATQIDWLDDALATSRSQWKIVCMHHPPYSSGVHGSTLDTHRALVPALERHGVDLVLSGHDHHYERTLPINGVTYVISGGGAKLRPTSRSAFTAVATSALQYLHVEVAGDRLVGRCVQPDGDLVDTFTLRAREGARPSGRYG